MRLLRVATRSTDSFQRGTRMGKLQYMGHRRRIAARVLAVGMALSSVVSTKVVGERATVLRVAAAAASTAAEETLTLSTRATSSFRMDNLSQSAAGVGRSSPALQRYRRMLG